MSSRFRNVALIGKYQASSGRALSGGFDNVMEGIGAFLEAQGCTVFVEKSQTNGAQMCRYEPLTVEQIGKECDLGLVVGGDGTMLGIGRRLVPYDIPLIGINRGRLGFITDIALNDYPATLIPMLAGEYEEDCRKLMGAQVMRKGVPVFDALALNDVVVNRGGTSGMVELRVTVGHHLVANQRADGLIIASSTGSTAYALSAGGPLLHPAIRGWVMAPIAPHTLSNRPIVLPDTEEISLELVSGRNASANFDMQSLASLTIGDRVVVRRSDHHIRFLHPRGWSYFETLRKKLHWNAGGS
jgi:NAD+ kinase